MASPSHQQELVNLLLTGRAVSNVFNDVVELDSGNGNITLLRGIAARSDIGFLSLFEHYNVCQVPTLTFSRPWGGWLPETGKKRAQWQGRRAGLPFPEWLEIRSCLSHRVSGKTCSFLAVQ